MNLAGRGGCVAWWNSQLQVVAAADTELVGDAARRRLPDERRVVNAADERHPASDGPVLDCVAVQRGVHGAGRRLLPADQHLAARQPASAGVDGRRWSTYRLHRHRRYTYPPIHFVHSRHVSTALCHITVFMDSCQCNNSCLGAALYERNKLKLKTSYALMRHRATTSYALSQNITFSL